MNVSAFYQSKQEKLSKLPYWKNMFFQLTQLVALGIVFIIVSLVLSGGLSEYGESQIQLLTGNFWRILLKLLLGAFIETFLFQFVIFQFSRFIWFVREKIEPLIFIIISSTIFVLAHLHTDIHAVFIVALLRIIYRFFSGVILSTSFYIFQVRRQKPLLSVTAIHLVFNLLVCTWWYICSLNYSI